MQDDGITRRGNNYVTTRTGQGDVNQYHVYKQSYFLAGAADACAPELPAVNSGGGVASSQECIDTVAEPCRRLIANRSNPSSFVNLCNLHVLMKQVKIIFRIKQSIEPTFSCK